MYLLKRSRKNYLLHKEAARELVHAHLEAWNKHYNLPLRKVFIKNSRSRWGSCSTLGNLNFNYRIVFLPVHLQKYLVVHELCHLKVFSHSSAFWALVAEQVPEYKKHRQEIRQTSLT